MVIVNSHIFSVQASICAAKGNKPLLLLLLLLLLLCTVSKLSNALLPPHANTLTQADIERLYNWSNSTNFTVSFNFY